MLSNFYQLYGRHLNAEKSKCYSVGILESYISTLLERSSFRRGSLPGKYWEIPLFFGKLTVASCKVLTDGITVGINHWSSRYLSYVGRIQLIKSVNQSMMNFWNMHFILPKKAINMVESKCSVFLWKEKEATAKGAKVTWSDMCFPQAKGGLGIKNLHIWNVAWILKNMWLLFSSADSLWVAWNHEYLFKGRNF